MKDDIINFLEKVNSAHAYKMASESVKIEAWPVAGPESPHSGKGRKIESAEDFAIKELRNSWVRLRFHFADGGTFQEEFFNG